MRNFCFAAAFLLFAGTCFAGDSSRLSPPQNASTASEMAGNDDGIFLAAPGADSPANSAETKDKSKEVCLKLRTYMVNRQERFSDDDRVSRYTDCQPAAKYQVRSTTPQDKPQSR